MGATNGVVSAPDRSFAARSTRTLREPGPDPAERVYTTGAVARLCGVCARTVAKWVRLELIPGAFVLPVGRDRRIPERGLVAFLSAHGMPVPAALGGGLAVCVNCPGPPAGYDPVDPVECGALAARGSLGSVVVGCADGLAAACRLARHLRATDPAVRLLVLLADDKSSADVPAGVFDGVHGGRACGG